MEDEAIRLPAIDGQWQWDPRPAAWSVIDGSRESAEPTGPGLSITAGPRTDIFVDPTDGRVTLDAPRLLRPAEGDFQLSAHVDVAFGATFDAGVLVVWADETSWAKLCLELSPEGQPMVVSVVTRRVSDDANSFDVDGHSVWFRVSRRDAGYAFHASTDGRRWQFVRHFALDPPDPAKVRVGFEAQSPTGDGCSVTFTELRYVPDRLTDLRDGS